MTIKDIANKDEIAKETMKGEQVEDKDKGEGGEEEKEANKDTEKEALIAKLAELEAYKEKTEKERLDKEKELLISQGKLEEVYWIELKQKEELIKQKELELLEIKKEKILGKYWISEKFWKFVIWNTPEELEASAKELSEELGTLSKEDNKRGLIDKLPNTGKDSQDSKTNKSRVFTIEEIKNMSIEEYKTNKEEIDKQMKAWLIK